MLCLCLQYMHQSSHPPQPFTEQSHDSFIMFINAIHCISQLNTVYRMYLHGTPAHADHFEQGDGFHISIFELIVLCPSQTAMTALRPLAFGILRAFSGFPLSSLYMTNTLKIFNMGLYVSIVELYDMSSSVPQSSVCFHFSHLRRDELMHRKRRRLLSSLCKQDAHEIVCLCIIVYVE